MKDHLVPKVGEHRLYDLTSNQTSLETKASTARWYAEMMIDLFFSYEAKSNLGEDAFNKLSLGDKISILRKPGAEKLTQSLDLIKDFGDKASHYQPGRVIKESDVEKVVTLSLELFDLALIDLMKNGGIRKTEITAKLFSTFLPSIRIRVLKSIINMRFIRPDSDEDMFILDKILLAYTKNGEIKKARRLLEKLQKQGALPQSHVEFWKEKIQIIQEKLEAGILPVSENISDCRRNFENVLSQMNESEKEQNSDLIKVFEVMLAQVEPSDLGDKIPDLVILM
ncbi:hypothetical protein [Pseudomonas rhodesiae]|uniref:hypothetical protein n=1 Tax=Pseudomonas rhodesiae TaxID=76760 RepID=UPI0028A1AD4A|nr:hypothetical protein [Pseudomonas rhodesiae]